MLVFEQQKRLATGHGYLRCQCNDESRRLAKDIITDFFAGSDYPMVPAMTVWDNGYRQFYRVELSREACDAVTELPEPMRRPLLEALGARVMRRLAAEFIPSYR